MVVLWRSSSPDGVNHIDGNEPTNLMISATALILDELSCPSWCLGPQISLGLDVVGGCRVVSYRRQQERQTVKKRGKVPTDQLFEALPVS